MADKFCPGAINISGTPTLETKKCKQCGADVELFSSDQQRVCEKCGFTIYNNIQSCILWCKSAIECVGEEAYYKLINNKKEGTKEDNILSNTIKERKII